jgi:hypothetical protein
LSASAPKVSRMKVGAGQHFVVVVGGDVGREDLGLAGLVHGALHRVVHQRIDLLRRAEHLVALRLVVLDEIAAQPELVGGGGEGLGAQAELGLDDGAGDVAAVLDRTAEDAPQVGDVLGRAVEQLDRARRHVEVVHLGVFDVAHALVVADHQRQEGHQHHAAIGDVAVEQVDRVGDAHFLGRLVDVIHQRIDALGEVVGGRHFDVGAGRGLGGEVGRAFQVAGARLGLHLVGHQDVPAALDQVFFPEAQVGIAVRLIHSILLVFSVAKNSFGVR